MAVTNKRIADALRSANWAGVSIGNKNLIAAAIDALDPVRPPGLPADLSNEDVKALFAMPDNDDSMHQQDQF